MAFRKARITHPIFGTIAQMPTKGYWRVWSRPWRGYLLHRAVWEHIAGRKLPEGWEVHHMDHDNQHNCGCNLLAMPRELHMAFYQSSIRHPYTGRWMKRAEYERVLGVTLPTYPQHGPDTPTRWVTGIETTPGTENEAPF